MFHPEILLGSGVVAGLLYVGLSPRVAKLLYRPILFHPARYPEGYYDIESIDGIAPIDVYFKAADGTRLHAWFFKLDGAERTILFHHGNAANLTTRLGLIQLQLRAGASVFIYDYRGFGRSECIPDTKGICDDGCAAFDYLVEKEGIDPENIINYGESLGAAVACQVSTVRHGGGLILQSGFSSLRRIGCEVVPWVRIYPQALYPKPCLNSVCVVEREHPPLLIMHGVNDTVVPFEHALELYERACPPKTFVEFPEADHCDLSFVEPERYETSIREFLLSLATAADKHACMRERS